MTNKNFELVAMTSKEAFKFLDQDQSKVLARIVKANRDGTSSERAMRLHILADISIANTGEELNFYLAGVVNILHKHFKGDREVLKTALEIIMESITEIENNNIKL